MRFNMNNYHAAIVADCKEKGIWRSWRNWDEWEEMFHKLGFSSYKYGYEGGKWHYLSEAEFVIFALRYSS